MGKGKKQKQKKKGTTMAEIQFKNPSSIFIAAEEKKEWANDNVAIKIEIVNKQYSHQVFWKQTNRLEEPETFLHISWCKGAKICP